MSTFRWILSLALFLSAPVSGQSLFIAPHIGGGTSNWGGIASNTPWGKNDIALRAGADIGLMAGNWQFSAGLAALRTGATGEIATISFNNSPTQKLTYKARFSHMLVPIQAGYNINIGKVALCPQLGIAPGYLLDASMKLTDLSTGETTRDEIRFSPGAADAQRFALFGSASIIAKFRLSGDMKLLAGISYEQMVNSIAGGGSIHPSALTGRLGVQFEL